MQTTVDIPDELYRQIESKAAREGVPVGHLIAQTLRQVLGETPPAGRKRIAFPLHRATRPGALSVDEVRAAEEATVQEEDALRAGTL